MTSTVISCESTHGATVVINHRVKGGQHVAYECWLNEIGPLCRAASGCLDWQIIRPIAGLSESYAFIIRFDTEEHLQAWMGSPARADLIAKVRPLLMEDDQFRIRPGLDCWFAAPSEKAAPPRPWKQMLLTWSAIYPLILLVPMFVIPGLRRLDITSNYLDKLFISGVVVFVMTYVVMPRYTKLMRAWLAT